MLRLYDTLTRQIADIAPVQAGGLSVYACGPTVYRFAHVGNMRTFLLTDLIRRVAQRHRLQVDVVQNITDVGHLQDDVNDLGDDKLLLAAKAEGKSALEIARFYEQAFHRDLAALNIHPAGHYPRASDHIDDMVRLIERLIALGHAYLVPGGTVYFDAKSWPAYGELSGNRLDHLHAGHRFEGAEDPAKRFHADWALWKGAGASREMVWESPWGPGFPGWHVECSAMSLRYLGDTVDVHTGGIDLRFPHHEDERAQSEAAAGHPVVRHWVHAEHLLFAGRKMAKSTGNVLHVADVVERGYDPLALRLAFLEHRYRQQLNLTWDSIAAADRTLRRWRARVAEWAEAPSKPMRAGYVPRVYDAFDDDLDTPAALQVLRRVERDEELAPGSRFEMFAHLDALFGLDVVADVGQPPATLPTAAARLLSEREQARAGKDWARSDRLREELAGLGVDIRDTADGQSWSRS